MTATSPRTSVQGVPSEGAAEPHEARRAALPVTPSVGTSPERAAQLLLQAVRDLSKARTREAVAEVVKVAARALVAADGATFVLRDGDKCFYLDEDAVSPLWKGQRFPAHSCVSGWVMEHAEQAVMEDIYIDPRVPFAAYRPTFVKSLVMTPVRREQPVAAIGIYWAHTHRATEQELALLQDLADTTAVALENAAVYAELERRVAERTYQLTQVNRELEAFSYSVAHDLRSPLSAILGFAELIEDRLPRACDESLRVFAAEIVVAGKRMNTLIGALLEFARCARVTIDKSQVDLSASAHAIAERLLAEVTQRNVEVDIEPGLAAQADATLVDVVLTNLLSNAFKYTSKEEHALIVVGSRADERGTTFYVRDNGAGFDPQDSEQLFVPFQRLHAQREFQGSGIGLATVARIVRRHGGRIWAEGERGQGATFYFSLPNEC